jgi:hypothetical protein
VPAAKAAPINVQNFVPRLEAAAAACRAGEKALLDERELRRRIVNEATDAGMSARAIARALGGGTGMVSKILAQTGPEEP